MNRGVECLPSSQRYTLLTSILDKYRVNQTGFVVFNNVLMMYSSPATRASLYTFTNANKPTLQVRCYASVPPFQKDASIARPRATGLSQPAAISGHMNILSLAFAPPQHQSRIVETTRLSF